LIGELEPETPNQEPAGLWLPDTSRTPPGSSELWSWQQIHACCDLLQQEIEIGSVKKETSHSALLLADLKHPFGLQTADGS
jgi:hypothetical protein